MKILIFNFCYLFISTGIVLASDSDCLRTFQPSEKNTYTLIAVCDDVVSGNIENSAAHNLVSADLCVVKKETKKRLSKFSNLLVKGVYQTQSLGQNPLIVHGGIFARSKKLKSMPNNVVLETKYADSIELDVYDFDENTLTVSRGFNGEFLYNAKLACRRL